VKLLLSRGADVSLPSYTISTREGSKVKQVSEMITGDAEMIR
jgi:hypothetical protein